MIDFHIHFSDIQEENSLSLSLEEKKAKGNHFIAKLECVTISKFVDGGGRNYIFKQKWFVRWLDSWKKLGIYPRMSSA